MAAVSPVRANALLLGVMGFAQLLLMAASVRQSVVAGAVSGATGSAGRPAVAAERSLSGTLVAVVHFFGDLNSEEIANAALKREVTRLSGELTHGRAQAEENERLRRLLGMKDDLVPKSIGASVVTAQIGGQSRVIVIDRGSTAGVRPDMAVVAWGGAVGRVVSVDREYARVRLLSDPSSGVSGIVARSRAEGIVAGRGGDALEMLYVPKYADVLVGDRVVTSGLDGVFPRGLGIGRITVVGDPIGASKSIRLEPEVADRAVEEVLVLTEPTGTRLLTADGTEAKP
ncbi:MAG TPA: rod shape-determining protein MreC [Candidatus Polarisedimenticolaceae bacterium]|nr:rod shape-determining protein MreC [Candidatus Polarisedimenticolaceae bacterium]